MKYLNEKLYTPIKCLQKTYYKIAATNRTYEVRSIFISNNKLLLFWCQKDKEWKLPGGELININTKLKALKQILYKKFYIYIIETEGIFNELHQCINGKYVVTTIYTPKKWATYRVTSDIKWFDLNNLPKLFNSEILRLNNDNLKNR